MGRYGRLSASLSGGLNGLRAAALTHQQGSAAATSCRVLARCSSSVFVETDQVGLFSEASSANHELILSDETVSSVADSASAGVLTELSGVRVKLVGHVFI